MKRMFVIIGLLLALGTGAATAQTRVGVSVSFGDPYFGGHVVIGRPYYHRYSRPYYHRYQPPPVIIFGPRVYRSPRVIVVRPHRYHPRRGRYHRRW